MTREKWLVPVEDAVMFAKLVGRRCPECGRVFDLTDEVDAEEWAYGHDCEADEEED